MLPSKKSLFLFFLLISIVVFPISAQKKQPNIERRINALLVKMTLEEKLGQLQQLDGEADGRFRPEHLELARKGCLVRLLMCAAQKHERIATRRS
jgi:hypothetical protein